MGYGHVRPTVVFNGGDPTGRVITIVWMTWGGRRAIGHGIGYFAGTTVAKGHSAPVTIVAFMRGTCGGRWAYKAVDWYPAGQSFDSKRYLDICHGSLG